MHRWCRPEKNQRRETKLLSAADQLVGSAGTQSSTVAIGLGLDAGLLSPDPSSRIATRVTVGRDAKGDTRGRASTFGLVTETLAEAR